MCVCVVVGGKGGQWQSAGIVMSWCTVEAVGMLQAFSERHASIAAAVFGVAYVSCQAVPTMVVCCSDCCPVPTFTTASTVMWGYVLESAPSQHIASQWSCSALTSGTPGWQ